ncbi:MAG TPA: hypothetical protein VMP11_02450 [Verrucomicrobiae bacterium]|nr:hypothetical protein [Verrucomicrobiae bacterium]
MSQLLKRGPIPKWRLAFWAAVAMTVVACFVPYEEHQLLFWLSLILGGGFIVGMAVLLSWEDKAIRTNSSAGLWLKKNAGWLLAISILASALLKLWDSFRRR